MKKASKVCRPGSSKCFEGDGTDFVLDALWNFQPVQRFKDGCNMREF